MELKQYTGQDVKKPVRTISGVTPLTVVLKPRKCDHGTCIYCPGGDHVPQSYTDKSPAIMRALGLAFDPYEQVMNRLGVLNKMGHPTDKIELIVLGGTFLQYPLDYQQDFIKRCYDAFNGKDSKDLDEAKKLNETAEHRCVAMCIENRPDNCSKEEIKRMLDFGATRVEIGVQMPDDELYKKLYDKNINVYRMLCNSELGELWIQRTKLIKAVVEEGFNVIHSDADAVWLNNPINEYFINQDYDIIFSQGTFWPQDVHKEWGFVLCCGLYYIRSNERTKKLLSKVKNELEIERDDQVSFNKTLLKENVVWDINTYYYLEHQNIKFLCSNQPITGNAGDVSILVLPHAKFPRVNDASDLVYVKHILSDKNSVSVIDTLKNNDCYFI